MKITKTKKLSPHLSILLNYRWPLIISALICAIVSVIARYTFHIESYSSSTVLGLASGLGFIAALWLTYSIVRIK